MLDRVAIQAGQLALSRNYLRPVGAIRPSNLVLSELPRHVRRGSGLALHAPLVRNEGVCVAVLDPAALDTGHPADLADRFPLESADLVLAVGGGSGVEARVTWTIEEDLLLGNCPTRRCLGIDRPLVCHDLD